MKKRKIFWICACLILLSAMLSICVLAQPQSGTSPNAPQNSPMQAETPEGSNAKEKYTLTFSSNSEEMGMVELQYNDVFALGNTHQIPQGDTVVLMAKPKEGYRLKRWVSEDSAFELPDDRLTMQTISFLMPKSDVTLRAEFEKEPLYSLTIERDDISGESYVVSGKDQFREGETVRVDAMPYDGFAFVEWGESCDNFDLTPEQKNSTKLQFQMPAEDVVLTMKFTPITYYFQIKVQGTGTVEVLDKKPNAAGKYECTVGEEIAISAEPGEEFSFINWTGINGAEFSDYDLTETTLICPASDFTVTANFASSVFELTVSGSEGGTVSPEGTLRLGVDNIFNLVAIPKEGYVFSGWQCSSESGKFEDTKDAKTAFTMPAENCTVTALFQKGGYKLKVAASTGGQVQGLEGEYEMGEKIPLKAIPSVGYVFSHWTCEGAKAKDVFSFPSASETEVTMPGSDLNVTAVFLLKTTAGSISVTAPKQDPGNDFPWGGIILVFVLSSIAITLVVIREKYNLSYRYLLRKWWKGEE